MVVFICSSHITRDCKYFCDYFFLLRKIVLLFSRHSLLLPQPTMQSGAQQFELSSPPNEGITNVVFCPNTSMLLVSSWDAV